MLVSLASLAVTSNAYADWTLGVFVGMAHTRPASLTLIQPREDTDVTLSPVRYRSESLAPPIYYGYRVAFFPGSRWLGVEGEFVHLKVVADTARDVEMSGTLRGSPVGGSAPLSSIIEAFSITHGVNLLLVNAVARRRAGLARQETRDGRSPPDSAPAHRSPTPRARLADGGRTDMNGARRVSRPRPASRHA
jgi:hypothetical protein